MIFEDTVEELDIPRVSMSSGLHPSITAAYTQLLLVILVVLLGFLHLFLILLSNWKVVA